MTPTSTSPSLTATQLTAPAVKMHEQDARAAKRHLFAVLFWTILVCAVSLAGAAVTYSTIEASRLIALPLAFTIGCLLHAQIAGASHLLTTARRVPHARREHGIGLALLVLGIAVMTFIAVGRIEIMMDRGTGLVAAACVSLGLLVLECSLPYGAGHLLACACIALAEAREEMLFSQQLMAMLVSNDSNRSTTWANVYRSLCQRVQQLRQDLCETIGVANELAQGELERVQRRLTKVELYAPVALPDSGESAASPFKSAAVDGHASRDATGPGTLMPMSASLE